MQLSLTSVGQGASTRGAVFFMLLTLALQVSAAPVPQPVLDFKGAAALAKSQLGRATDATRGALFKATTTAVTATKKVAKKAYRGVAGRRARATSNDAQTTQRDLDDVLDLAIRNFGRTIHQHHARSELVDVDADTVQRDFEDDILELAARRRGRGSFSNSGSLAVAGALAARDFDDIIDVRAKPAGKGTGPSTARADEQTVHTGSGVAFNIHIHSSDSNAAVKGTGKKSQQGGRRVRNGAGGIGIPRP